MKRLVVLALLLAACDDMAAQDRHRAFEAAPDLPGAMTNQPPVPQTVARGSLVDVELPEITAHLLARGGDRFAIFCVPCHGATGQGDGPVAGRTMPAPPPFGEVDDLSLDHVGRVITDGHGPMPPYGDRIAVPDRLAIAAHVLRLREAQE